MERKKQIEEMADDISSYIHKKEKRTMLIITDFETSVHRRGLSEHLYNAGYRKERQGEWVKCKIGNTKTCSLCNDVVTFDSNYCPNCGAKMKGAENENS